MEDSKGRGVPASELKEGAPRQETKSDAIGEERRRKVLSDNTSVLGGEGQGSIRNIYQRGKGQGGGVKPNRQTFPQGQKKERTGGNLQKGGKFR